MVKRTPIITTLFRVYLIENLWSSNPESWNEWLVDEFSMWFFKKWTRVEWLTREELLVYLLEDERGSEAG